MKNVLIVDDSPNIRKLIRNELQDAEYNIIEAENGFVALAKVAESLPDIITLDIEMPKLNGFDTLKKIREIVSKYHEASRNIPVIFVTSHDNLQDRIRGFELGATEFIVKPFQKGELLNSVNRILNPGDRLKGLTALIADDSRTDRNIISECLKKEGLNIFEADNGLAAFEIICNHMSEIDIVIADFVMPNLDGNTLCQKIRKELNLNIPIIILTGGQNLSKLLTVFKSGATDYLVKPFVKEELFARLIAHLDRTQIDNNIKKTLDELHELSNLQDNIVAVCSHDLRAPLSSIVGLCNLFEKNKYLSSDDSKILSDITSKTNYALNLVNNILETMKKRDKFQKESYINFEKFNAKYIEENSVAESVKNLKVLIVEDNPINQQVASDILRSAEIFIDIANNGYEAISFLKEKNYDVILMDIQMPGINGYDTAKLIRTDLKLKDIPIIAMTAHVVDEEIEKCFSAGMNAYVPKPISSNEVLSVIHQCLKSLNPVSLANKKVEKPIEHLPFNDLPPYLPGIDVQDFLNRSNGNTKLLKKILLVFLDNCPFSPKDIKNAILSNDTNKAKFVAHSIKGISANISAKTLFNYSKEIEACIQNFDANEFEKIFIGFEKAFEDVILASNIIKSFEKSNRPIEEEVQFDIEKISTIILKMKNLIIERDFYTLEYVEELKKHLASSANVKDKVELLAKQVNEFNFNSALQSLEQIANALKISLSTSTAPLRG
ncbi:MAG: response regulator [Desulfobacterales bacterium]|nr:response regulator [Desulfobacterales bacterium]